MGFGPKPSSVTAGVQAVRDLIELLYPERASKNTLKVLEDTTRALLTAKVPLSFENMDRFWRDVAWRQFVLARIETDREGPWDAYPATGVSPATVDQNFGWLIDDRLNSGSDWEIESDD